MREDTRIYFHTNVPAPYRKHQFEAIAKRFPNAKFLLTERQANYRPWSNSVRGWKADICHVSQMQLLLSLLMQRWGSIRVCGAGIQKWYWLLLMISGIIGHSKIIAWNDGCTVSEVNSYKRKFGRKLSIKMRILRWLTLSGHKAVFTPGINGANRAKAMGFTDNQIINAYFSHDVDYFSMYEGENHASAHRQIRLRHGIAKNKIVLLCISRYLDLKRLEDLAEALLILERDHSNEAKECELMLIGDGSWKVHLATLEKLKDIKVHLVNQMPPEEVLGYYCASDIFVFPSEGDVWGLVVNEALSMGLPVICTDEIGAAELVESGVNGYTVPIRHPEIIADRISLLLNLKRRLAFSNAAKRIRTTWRTDFGVEGLLHYLQVEQ